MFQTEREHLSAHFYSVGQHTLCLNSARVGEVLTSFLSRCNAMTNDIIDDVALTSDGQVV